MKYLAILLLAFIITNNSNSQFSIELGQNKIYCTGNINGGGPYYIGDSLTITGGVPPFTYRWESSYTFLSYHSSSSDYLSDTTISNPTITNFSNDSNFYLYVTDSLRNVAYDSIKMRYSSFYKHLGNVNYSINQGDSIYLSGMHNVSGGINPVTVLWRPNHGLTDSTSLSFWAKPTKHTNYYMVVTDSIGCKEKGGPVYWIAVNNVSIDEKNLSNSNVKVFPNPSNEFITLSYEGKISTLINYTIFNSEGKIVYQKESDKESITFETNQLEKGVYFYSINSKNTEVGKGKFVVN